MPNLHIKFHQNPLNSLGGVALTSFRTCKPHVKPLSWIISLSKHPAIIILLHAHLYMMPNLQIKFHQNPLNGLGGVALTRYMDRQTDGRMDRQTDRVIPIYPQKRINFNQ